MRCASLLSHVDKLSDATIATLLVAGCGEAVTTIGTLIQFPPHRRSFALLRALEARLADVDFDPHVPGSVKWYDISKTALAADDFQGTENPWFEKDPGVPEQVQVLVALRRFLYDSNFSQTNRLVRLAHANATMPHREPGPGPAPRPDVAHAPGPAPGRGLPPAQSPPQPQRLPSQPDGRELASAPVLDICPDQADLSAVDLLAAAGSKGHSD